MNVKGEGGVDFERQTNLMYVKKSYAVFIQTDKPVYKPGDVILFRAIVLNPNLKPSTEVTDEPIHVHVLVSKMVKISLFNSYNFTLINLIGWQRE